MDFEKLFNGMKLDKIGRESFYALNKRMEKKSFSDSFKKACEIYPQGDVEFGEYIEEFAKRENISADVLTLYIYLRKCEQSLEEYEKRGMDPEIFYATMADVSYHCDLHYKNTGVYGIPQKIYRRWYRRFLDCIIFRIGRFNFEVKASEYDLEIDGIKVAKGETCISVHIPGGSKLDPVLAEESYTKAREFFSKYFSLNPPVFYCGTWLLQPWLADALPEESGIVQFQKKYKIEEVIDHPGETLIYVFPERLENPDDYPENTRIQRATKERLKKGETVGYARGVRL